jgi:hypothetical protein
MFEYLEKLRAKPPKTKKKVAFLVSFSLAGIIFVVWLTIIFPDFKQTQDKIDNGSSTSTSPFSHFKEMFSNSFYEASDNFKNAKETVSSIGKTPELNATTTATTTNTTATSTGRINY